MPKQERRVYFDLANGDMKPRRVDGAELPNWEHGPTMPIYIKQLQTEGWNLTRQLSPHIFVFEHEAP